MTNPAPKVHDELAAFAKELSTYAKKIGRLETLIEVRELIQNKHDSTKSVIEARTYKIVIKLLEGLN